MMHFGGVEDTVVRRSDMVWWDMSNLIDNNIDNNYVGD